MIAMRRGWACRSADNRGKTVTSRDSEFQKPHRGVVAPSWSVNEGSLLPTVATQPPGHLALRSTATHGSASTLTYNRGRSAALHDGQIFHRRSSAEVLNISKLPYDHRRYWRPVALGGIRPRLCLRFVALNCIHSRFLNRRWAPTKTANV